MRLFGESIEKAIMDLAKFIRDELSLMEKEKHKLLGNEKLIEENLQYARLETKSHVERMKKIFKASKIIEDIFHIFHIKK